MLKIHITSSNELTDQQFGQVGRASGKKRVQQVNGLGHPPTLQWESKRYGLGKNLVNIYFNNYIQ